MEVLKIEENKNKIGFSKRDILLVIFKHKVSFFSILLITTIMVSVCVYTLPLPHKASGTLIVERTKARTIPNLISSSMPIERDEVMNTEIEILQSRRVAEMVVDKFLFHELPPSKKLLVKAVRRLKQHLYDLGLLDQVDQRAGAIAAIMEKVKVKTIPLSNVIKISYVHIEPEQSSQIINAMMDAYLERRSEIYKDSGAQNFYLQQANLFKEELKNLRHKERQLKIEQANSKANNEAEATSRALENLRMQLRNALIRHAEIKENIYSLDKTSSYVPINNKDASYHIIDTIGSRLLELDMEKSKLSQMFKLGSTEITRIGNEINRLKKSLADSLNSISNNLLTRIKILETQIKSLEEGKQLKIVYDARLDEIASSIGFAEQSYNNYLNLQEQARLNENTKADLGNVKVLDYALVPIKPVFPKAVFIIVGFIIALGSAYWVVLISEYFDNRIDSEEDIENRFGLQVFCILPEVRRRRFKNLSVNNPKQCEKGQN